MKKLILALLILSSPAYAGSAILNLSGTNNVLNLTQMADSNVLFNATDPNTINNIYTIKQSGGGNHQASIDIEGNFQNYNFYLSQNSSQNLSISIQQICNNPVCSSASPYLVNQY
jgi:hypothetical protein